MVASYIGLGSNLDDPEQQIVTALQALAQVAQSRLVNTSSLYISKPVGPQDQPDYLNAVAELDTLLPASDLLQVLQAQENRQGRKRTQRWGPRTLDLDLLLYGQEIIRQPDLVVPHPEMYRRAFVLLPLAELAPQLDIPGMGRLSELLRQVETDGIKRYQADHG